MGSWLSPDFQVRESATRGLAALGEKAAGALETARKSPDPEVRRRVARLLRPFQAAAHRRELETLKRQVAGIRKSTLAPREKADRLKNIITKGMTRTEVERVLGKERYYCPDGWFFRGEKWECGYYYDFSIKIYFNRLSCDTDFRVVNVVLWEV